ncbi:hypothetical protein [Halohasta salina]|uniref:hypothetical protein n=1 Tax=Halohasta salina TaxID=2961621 RepID=UPI0020A42C39|nr:hypothetical protein [Halohasta salina]
MDTQNMIFVSPDRERKSLFEVFAIAFLLGLSIALMTVFNAAILGGGTTVVDVAQHGEMVQELLLLHFVVLPTVSVGLYHWHRS